MIYYKINFDEISSTLPVFVEKVLVVPWLMGQAEGCYPNADQCSARSDERELMEESSLGQLEMQLAALSSGWSQKNPGEENLRLSSPVGRKAESRQNQWKSWSFNDLVSGESVCLSVCLSVSLSKLGLLAVFTPRCVDWGILGNLLKFRVHVKIHNKQPHLWVPTRL